MIMTAVDKKVLLFSGILIFLLTALNLHGFSLSYWHKIIDQSPENEILIGSSRGIRGDDFIIEIPLAVSQSQSPRPFSHINDNIGTGAIMGIPFKVPVLSPLLIFQPAVWGYFISDAVGISFSWWFMVFGTLLSVYGLTRTFTKSCPWIAMTAALFFTVSPYIQFWSYHVSEIFIFGAAAVLSLIFLIKNINELSFLGKISLTLFSGWSMGAFLTVFVYPPFLVTLGYVFLMFFISWSLQNPEVVKTFLKKLSNLQFVAGAFLIFLCAVFLLRSVSGDAIDLISKTTYPGQRFLTGGHLSVWRFLLDQIYTQVEFLRLKNWGERGNICEAASFVLFSPVVFSMYLYTSLKKKAFPRVLLPLFALLILLVIYTNFGLPAGLSQWTLLSKVPDYRTLFAIGALDFLILIFFFNDDSLRTSMSTVEKFFFCLIHVGILLIAMGLIRKEIPEIRAWMMIPGLVAQSFLIGFLLFAAKKRKYFFLLLTLSIAPYSLAFNPLVRGGLDFIHNNNLAKAMKAQSQARPDSRWAVVALEGDTETLKRARNLANYPRMIGVPSVGGYMCPPQMSFIKDLELIPEYQAGVNQCAYNTFLLSRNKTEPVKVQVETGMLLYQIPDNHNFFLAQKVDFFIGVGTLPPDFRIEGFEKTFEEKSLSIWARQ